jgi:hypothetical protein
MVTAERIRRLTEHDETDLPELPDWQAVRLAELLSRPATSSSSSRAPTR